MTVLKKGTLREFAKNKLKSVNGRISDRALDVFVAEVEDFCKRGVEHGWVEANKSKKRTILEKHAKMAVETVRYTYISGLVKQLVWKVKAAQEEQLLNLKQIGEEVLENDKCRADYFEKDGRGRKRTEGQDATLE